MGSFMSKISRAGLTLVIIGAVLLGFSLGDALISFKPAVSFDGAYENGVEAGDHVSGRVPLLGDSFATLQTWTEDRSNNSRTPAKTSAVYYMFQSTFVLPSSLITILCIIIMATAFLRL